jgi:hypothetical protein
MKIIKVENCGECPYFSGLMCVHPDHAYLKVSNPTTIHPDCPLADEKARYVVYNEVEGFKIIEEYDCPIHGKLGGIDECPLC